MCSITELRETSKGFSTTTIHYSQEAAKWTYMADPERNDLDKPEEGAANRTRQVLEAVLAKLDNGNYGLTFASGLGAITSILHLLKTGDHIIATDCAYGGTIMLLNEIAETHKMELTYVDATVVANIEKAVKPTTKMVWIESPANPTLKIIDIRAVADVTKRHNLLFGIDNTFTTSYFQKPLDLGADLVMYSITKYMNGHSDVLMGSVIINDKQLYEQLKNIQNSLGVTPSPFDCAQVLRGLQTLSLRMRKHDENSLILAKYLEKHPFVLKVSHPALPSHPQHHIFKKQATGHGGMLSFYIKGGLKEAVTFSGSLKLFHDAASLGGVESLVSVPVISSHIDVDKEMRERIDVTDNLIRLSVGIEDVEDLIDDIEQALNKAATQYTPCKFD